MQHTPKILIVDDRQENLFSLEKILSVLDARVIKAECGNDALIASLNHDFALAIVDVQMPEMDGYELVELLHGQEQTRNLPIIFLSAVYHEDRYVFRGYEAGAVDFIIKPFHPRILIGKASVFLELARQRMESKIMAQQLHAANEALESRVRERTVSLEEANRALRISESELRALSARLLSAQEEERRRIASELHDSLGSSLSAVKFGLEHLSSFATDPETLESLALLTRIVRQSIDEVRRIMVNLRPPVLDSNGLLPALKWLQERLRPIYGGINIEREIGVHEEEIPESLKIVIFRIVQEALNNTAKHNREATVRIALTSAGDRLDLCIQDDGRGFEVNDAIAGAKTKKCLGLTGMRERATLSGGAFLVTSSIGQGTRIQASWPMGTAAGSSGN